MNLIQKWGMKVLGLGGALSSFDGANTSTARSQVMPLSFDQRKQITPYTRKQLLTKYHSLRNNVGLVKRLVAGAARYAVGTGISPKAMTSDEEWNKLHDDWFEQVAVNPLLFDYEGRVHYYRAQKTVAMSVMGEGEIFTNCVDPEELGPEYYIPQFQLIAAAKVDNAGDTAKDNLFDGLVLDRDTNRVLKYRIPNTADNKGGYTDLDAEHVIHTYDPERVGQLRGITWLYHGVNSLIDILDLTALEKHAAKVHSALAAAVKNKSGNTGNSGLTGQLEALLTKAQQQQLQGMNPNARNAVLERIFGGGIVPFLNADEELQLLTSSRPSPVFTGFLDWLVRDIAWGFGVSPEFIWALAGMGGANTRTILADAQSFFTDIATMVIDGWAAPVRNRMVAAAILANQKNSALGIRDCKDPLWRTKIHWQTPPRITADPGKEAQANIDLLNNGMNTWADFWGGQGKTGRAKIQERIREVAQAMLDLEAIRKDLDPSGKVLTPEAFKLEKIIIGGGKPGEPPSRDPKKLAGKNANEPTDE